MFSEEDRRQVVGSSRERECELSSAGWGQRELWEGGERRIRRSSKAWGGGRSWALWGTERKAVVAGAGTRARDGAKEGQGKDGRLWLSC